MQNVCIKERYAYKIIKQKKQAALCLTLKQHTQYETSRNDKNNKICRIPKKQCKTESLPQLVASSSLLSFVTIKIRKMKICTDI